MIRPLLCTLFLSQAAIAVTYQPEWAAIAPKRVIQHTDSNGDALMKAVAALQPGDKLEIAAGTYSVDRMWDVSVSGSREAPIWITAAEGAQVIITRPDAKQNVINIGQSAPVAFLCLRGLDPDVALLEHVAHSAVINRNGLVVADESLQFTNSRIGKLLLDLQYLKVRGHAVFIALALRVEVALGGVACSS